MTVRPCAVASGIAGLLLLATAASAAQIIVMTSGGFTAPLLEVIPEFERATKHKVTTVFGASTGGAPDSIPVRLARGEPADVVILTAEALGRARQAGKVIAGTRTDLVRSRIGMAVRAGAPEAGHQLGRRARADAVAGQVDCVFGERQRRLSSRPSSFHDSESPMQMKPKTRRLVSERVGAVVRAATRRSAFSRSASSFQYAGIDYVGPLPDEVQRVSIFAAGVATERKQRDAARALIDFLASPRPCSLRSENTGLDPIRSRRRNRLTGRRASHPSRNSASWRPPRRVEAGTRPPA